MQCRKCGSTHIRKNCIKRGKQNHICVDYQRQFKQFWILDFRLANFGFWILDWGRTTGDN
jgi:hypothetical protein